MEYKLPLDDICDNDIIEWLAQFPRSKKAEIVRHALRYYITEQTKNDGQVFLMRKPTSAVEQPVAPMPAIEKKQVGIKVEATRKKAPSLNV